MARPASPERAAATADRRGLTRRRLAAMQIAPPARGGAGSIPATVARHLAMQAQDLAGGMWSIGLRTGASRADVEAAMKARAITRTWPMRGTLHFLATDDVRWMCRLLNARVAASTRARFAQLGITDAVLGAGRDLLTSALAGGGTLSRPAALELFRANGIEPDGQRGLHLLGRYCQEGLLCQGPPQGRQPTFVLLDEWVPHSWDPGREEAMAALAERYVLGHGPVTERDLAAWSGQGLGFVREAVALAGDRVATEQVGETAYLVHPDAPAPAARATVQLLPGFDEYLLGYRDRSAMLTSEQAHRVVPGGNGLFQATVVAGGQVVGTWRPRVTRAQVEVTVVPFGALPAGRLRAAERTATAYGRFLGLPARVSVDGRG